MLDASNLAPLLTCEALAGHAAYSPDGKTIAIKENTGDVALLDADTCHRRGTLTGSHTAGRVLFSPDGRRVIARSLDGIRMWDATTGRQVGDPLPDKSESLLGPGFAGGRLVSAAADELLTVFDLDPVTWFSKACATAGRNLTHDEWNRYVGNLGAYRATCTEYPVGT
jgi:WD40 repeat protein